MEEVRRAFRPEFLNRIDEIIVFHALEQGHIEQIASLMLSAVASRLAERGITLHFDEAAVRFLAREGYDLKFGARPLRRAIQRMVEDSLSEEILSGNIHLGESVHMGVDEENNVLTFLPEPDMLSLPELD